MNWLDRAESALVEVASKTGPILAPIPTAYLVGASTIEYLDWPLPIGIVASIVVECLGLASTGLALDLYDYQQSKRKTDPPAPFNLSVALVAIYFIVALALTVALDIVPELAPVAPAIFPALSLAGVTILAIRIGHRERLAEIERGKAKKRKSKQAPSERPVSAQPEIEQSVSAEWAHRWADLDAFRAEVGANLELVSGMKAPEFAQLTGKPASTARRWLADAKEIVKAYSDNGKE